MPFDPGPIVPSPMPLAPPIVKPREFEALGAEIGTLIAGIDPHFAGYIQTIAPMLTRNLETPYQGDVAPAVAGLAGLGPAADDVELAAIAGLVDVVLGEVGVQQLDLPGPDEQEPSVPTNPAPPPEGGDRE